MKQNKRKMYRIELKSMKDIAKEAAVLAALSNGNKHIDIKSIAAGAEIECMKYPNINDSITVNLIGDNVLTIDLGTENLLVLTEVEILELDCPTLTRQDAEDILTGIADKNNFESLN